MVANFPVRLVSTVKHSLVFIQAPQKLPGKKKRIKANILTFPITI